MGTLNIYLITLIRSCTDFKFYKSIFYQAFGKTLRYLLFLGIIVTLVMGIRYGIFLNKLSYKGLKWIEENVPYIEINDGIVTAEVQQPYIVSDKDVIMIIDTTGQIKAIDEKHNQGVLLTKEELIYKQDETRTQEIKLNKIKEFKLDNATLKKWRRIMIRIVIPLMVVMVLVQFFVAKIIQVLISGLIIQIFRSKLKYNNILNICVYALTPVTLLSLLVMILAPRPILLFSIVYLGMYAAFLIGGIRQIESQ